VRSAAQAGPADGRAVAQQGARHPACGPIGQGSPGADSPAAGDQPAQRVRRWPNAAGGPARRTMAQARGGRLAQPVKPTGAAETRNGPYAFH